MHTRCPLAKLEPKLPVKVDAAVGSHVLTFQFGPAIMAQWERWLHSTAKISHLK